MQNLAICLILIQSKQLINSESYLYCVKHGSQDVQTENCLPHDIPVGPQTQVQVQVNPATRVRVQEVRRRHWLCTIQLFLDQMGWWLGHRPQRLWSQPSVSWPPPVFMPLKNLNINSIQLVNLKVFRDFSVKRFIRKEFSQLEVLSLRLSNQRLCYIFQNLIFPFN